MADNIIIKITTEADLDAAQKQLQALTDKMKQQEAAVHDLTNQEKADAASIKEMVTERSKLNKALAENQRYYREEKQAKKDEIAATKQSIKELEKQVKAYKTLQGTSGTMVKQLRAMREELQRMEDAGQFGSKAFMDLAIAAGKLEDQIGDTQARIRVLSSDTIGLDTAIGVADGLAGAFYVATSAAEVFGSEMEELQEAFYRVQAAMSTLSGIQQVADALNKDSVVSVVLGTKLEERRQKALARSAAAERLYNMQKTKGIAITGSANKATKLWTAAQWKLNAAMAANPIAVVAIAIAAAGAVIFGLIKAYQRFFTESGKAQAAYNKSVKEFEKISLDVSVKNTAYAQKIVNNEKQIDDAYRKEMNAAKEKQASDMEMLAIEKKYADQKAKLYTDVIPKALDNQKKKVLESKKAYEEAQKVLNNTSGEKKRKKALEQLQEAEERYIESQNEYIDLQKQRDDAVQAATDAEFAIQDKLQEYRNQAQQANIDLMREGAAKEIAQIKVNYREQLKTLQGNSEEEIALRKALLKKQAKEIADVQRKYALQAQETAIQEQKNLLTAMSQAVGTEADYEKQIALTKKIAEAEAQAKIDALDKNVLSEKEYKAQVEAIRLELNNTLRDIDEQEVQRLNENAKRKTEIALMEAEAAANALKGSESVDYQKAAWEAYYNERSKQVEENAKHEIEAINRSTDSEEVKAAKVKQIELQLQADLEAIRKEGAQKAIDIDAQYLDELQRNVEKAERDVESTQGSGKLQALKDRFNAEQDLYQTQQEQLQAQYDAGLISYQEYKNQEWEIFKATTDSEVAYQQEKMQTIAEGFDIALGYMQEISDMAFGAINDNIQAEMDALDEMYTTDAEEAKANANKKYISEKELADKKAALELKQAKYAKAQALINAGINTALAITNALTTSPFPLGIAMAAIAAAMGAAQIGIIAAKPLAQYAKGRKGGKGEYALVGEKGPEVMYVPDGASIVPNHYLGDMDAWGKFGVPALPNDMMSAAMLQQINIDYDRLGKAVAANIPQQKAVSVNVDRNGVTISDNGNRRTYLNHKYAGSWS